MSDSCNPRIIAHQAQSMDSPGKIQEWVAIYPGDFPNPGMESAYISALQADFAN